MLLMRLRAFGSMLVVFVALLVSVMFSLQTDVGSDQVAPGPTVRVVPEMLGQQYVVVAITGTNMHDLAAFEFELTVNPMVAQFQGARVGPFLGLSGRDIVSYGPIIGEGGGNIRFGASTYAPSGNDMPGSSGDGVLAFVTITVVGEGMSPLDFASVVLTNVQGVSQKVVSKGATLQARRLHAGWNLVTPCVDTTGLVASEIFTSLSSSLEMAIMESGTYVPGISHFFPVLLYLPPSRSSFVLVTSPATWTLVLDAFNPTAPLTMLPGLQFVGYCLPQALPVTVALQSIDGLYSMVLGERGVYVVGLPDVFQSLKEMRQGEGYLIRMTGNGTLVYPSGGSSSRRPAGRVVTQGKLPEGRCTVQNTPYMTLVYGQVRVNGVPALPGTVVEAVTPRGEVAGCFEVHTAGYFGVMQVYGADEWGGIPGFQAGETITWRVNGAEAVARPAVVWQDDKALHEVVLEVSAEAESGWQQRLFVPWVLK